MKNKEEFIDDNSTIADMSNVGTSSPFSFIKKDKNKDAEKIDGNVRKAYILGALKSALLIGLVYGVVYFLTILAMYLFFKNK